MSKTEWAYTCAKALYLLGGRAHSNDIAAKSVELGEQNPEQDPKATVRDALQRYSADSAKGKQRGIARGSTLDLFRFEPLRGDSIFAFSSLDNPILRFVLGQLEGAVLKQELREAGAGKSLIEAVDSEEALTSTQIEETKRVFVHEHWRTWPGDGETETPSILLDQSNFELEVAWVTDAHVVVKFRSGLEVKAPLVWFPSIKNATMAERSNFEIHPSGIVWTDLGIRVVISDLLVGRPQ